MTEISLAGTWEVKLDRLNDADHQRLVRDMGVKIHLPGSIQEQGIGEELSAQTKWVSGIGAGRLSDAKYAAYEQPGNFRTPFWLTPRRHYVGAAWYQREIEIPLAWRMKRVVLHLERAHWKTTAWLDNRLIGTRDSLGCPDDFDLGEGAVPGKHRLTICVDNRLEVAVGPDAHSVSDQTQTDWNGIVGDISLQPKSKVWINKVQIYPNVEKRMIHVFVDIRNSSREAGDGYIDAAVLGLGQAKPNTKIRVQWDMHGGQAEFDYSLGSDAKLWDEFSPTLYRLGIRLHANGETDYRENTFGLRQIAARGTQFILNDHPIMLRGTLECCIFPLTGYPPTDIAPWRRIFCIVKDHGLNHVRFHSWCPPEAAFEAADEMGVYLSVECSCWAKQFGSDAKLQRWVEAESQRMVRAYGNHPSFMFMVPSNEPGKDDGPFLAKLISVWEKYDSRRLYTAGSGWPTTTANEYDVEYRTRLHDSKELNRPPQTATDYRQYVSQQKVPSVVHEMGQWCVYPNFDEIRKYTGALRAGNLEIFQDMLNKSGMGNQAREFLMASGKFQTELYKEEIEAVLRTPGIGGFQLLDLHDFPGQGTAPVGVLDAFWDAKPYVTAEQYRRFCNQTVPLARFAQRTFTSDQNAQVEIDVSHFGPSDLKDAKVVWKVTAGDGKAVCQGQFSPQTIAAGKLSGIGTIQLAMNQFAAPARMNLEVSIVGTPFVNDWDFWVYPADTRVRVPSTVSVVHTLDDATIEKLNQGDRVLLLLDPSRVAGKTHGDFAPIFWNRITFPTQINHTLGILCDPKSPALAAFPNKGHSDWQWWDLQQHCKPMILDGWPNGFKPTVQMIDDWDECRKLGLVVEARVGNGKLMICSIDLQTDLANRPAARQMLRSLLAYEASTAFSPKVSAGVDEIRSLLR